VLNSLSRRRRSPPSPKADAAFLGVTVWQESKRLCARKPRARWSRTQCWRLWEVTGALCKRSFRAKHFTSATNFFPSRFAWIWLPCGKQKWSRKGRNSLCCTMFGNTTHLSPQPCVPTGGLGFASSACKCSTAADHDDPARKRTNVDHPWCLGESGDAGATKKNIVFLRTLLSYLTLKIHIVHGGQRHGDTATFSARDLSNTWSSCIRRTDATRTC
jgi:hypothetical protein